MKLAKRLLIVAVAIAALSGLAAIFAPKTARGHASKLVAVDKTSANAVPTSDAGSAEEPFAFEGISSTTPVNATKFTTPSTTADGRTVERLVIENVTVLCKGLSTPASGVRVGGAPFSSAGVSLGSSVNEFFVPFPNNPAAGEQVLSQQTRIYVDPGVTVGMNALTFESSGICSYTAFGHFIVLRSEEDRQERQ